MPHKVAPPDLEIARIAGRQHGAITARQLAAAGLSRSAIAARTRRGRLHRLHQGVYAVGHVGPSHARAWMAAVLACGPGAVLSHRAAASLWKLLDAGRGPIDVSTDLRSGRAHQTGIRLHRCRSLAEVDKTERLEIPVTTPARTLADLRGAVPEWQWRRAVRQAEFLGMPLGFETDRARSDLEGDFLGLCRAHGLPRPEVNVRVGRLTVDFLWREQRLAIETDSYAYHRGQIAFQDDRARDLELRRSGFEVRRFSELQINARPGEVAEDLRCALGLRPEEPPPPPS